MAMYWSNRLRSVVKVIAAVSLYPGIKYTT